MYRKILLVWGVVALLALSPFATLQVSARSVIDQLGDDYIRFDGDPNHSPTEPYNITLAVQESSISAQWVNLDVNIGWPNLITAEGVDEFLVLANGKIVHKFYPQYVQLADGTNAWSSYYVAKPSIPELTGTNVYFQVVAVDYGTDGFQYAVAWSNITPEIKMDPLPVQDDLAISVLYQILAKLQEMLSELSAKLDKLITAVEADYTPSQQKLDETYAAINGLLDKMPMKEMSEEIEKLNDALEDSRAGLGQPYSVLVLGGEFEMIPGVAASRVKFLDLTPMTNLGGTNYVALFREICDAALWIWFFYMLFRWITPKPEV